ncbi:threonine aldolase family protein [Gracilimonas tropica]|uniref:threonine aldolase family protein n=1 Tax=Gracilimonas tropica TaxID=454600 RepID=UPI00037629AF|nr:GntG family PLP-dependent aldolase [Gracilimonas tropica]
MIDLRSDTITRPTSKMLDAMMQAHVGDDVFGEDETVNAFQEKVARMFGMEAGLFVPSGTMSNQLGVKVLTEPGDEILIDEKGHIFNYETGAASSLSGVQVRTLNGKDGKLDTDALQHTKRGHFDWEPRTKVICLENSTNKGGGVCYSEDELKSIKAFADQEELFVHLDGARIWNAITATDIEAEFFGEIADTISVCFSKGLGAPVGSMLLSSKERIAKARRFRKMWGGGMRQVGLLAAAADYALENNWEKLAEDHRRAREVAQVIFDSKELAVDMNKLQTNILIFDAVNESAEQVLEQLAENGIRMIQFGPNTIRATFHFEISDEDVEVVKEVLAEIGK